MEEYENEAGKVESYRFPGSQSESATARQKAESLEIQSVRVFNRQGLL